MSRCRFVTPEVVRLSLSDGDWVDVKKELNAGEQRRVFTDVVKTMHAGERAELDPEQVGKTKLIAFIVAWSFVDQDGRGVPFTPEALDDLDAETYGELIKAVDEHEDAAEKARAARKNAQSTSTPSEAISV